MDAVMASARNLGNMLVHGHRFGAIGEGSFHLDVGNLLRPAVHHLVAAQHGFALAHEHAFHASEVARSVLHLWAQRPVDRHLAPSLVHGGGMVLAP